MTDIFKKLPDSQGGKFVYSASPAPPDGPVVLDFAIGTNTFAFNLCSVIKQNHRDQDKYSIVRKIKALEPTRPSQILDQPFDSSVAMLKLLNLSERLFLHL